MFEWTMNSTCQNHSFVMTHLAKDCLTYQQRVTLEAEKRAEQDGYAGDRDDDQDADVAAMHTMPIFDGPQAYQD
jgi:hypothetical protein